MSSSKLRARVTIIDFRGLEVYDIFNCITMVGAAGKNFENHAFQIVSNRYFRVIISWKQGTNQVIIEHKLGHFY